MDGVSKGIKGRQHNHNVARHKYEKQRARTLENKKKHIARSNGPKALRAFIDKLYGVKAA